MKDEYYGDKRDLVKWGGIVHLCTTERIKNVIQVAYYRNSEWPKLSFNGEKVDLPVPVTKHFRDIEDIKRLANGVGLNIDVIKAEYKNRLDYHRDVCDRIKTVWERKVVFLDPDTGLAPDTYDERHVTGDELKMIWDSLSNRDYLVFFQHSFRDKDWIGKHRSEMTDALGLDVDRIKSWSSDIAKDVVFFFVEKVE